MGMPPQTIDKGSACLSRRETYLDFIVRESYDEIYECDLKRGRCRVLHNSASGARGQVLDLQQMLDEAGRSLIHPDDFHQLRELLDPASFFSRFAAGEREITAEYRRREGGVYHWYSLSLKLVPAGEAGNPAVMTALLLLKNIDVHKRAEEAARRLQTKYFLALRTSCGHICDLNAFTGRYVLSITGDSLLDQVPRQGDFDRLAKWMARTVIHPDDAQAWLSHMLLEKLRGCFAAGRRQFSIDYRFGSQEQGWQWRCDTAVWLSGETPQDDSILIFARDISEQKKAETLELSNRLLRQEIEHQKKNAAQDVRYRIIVEQTGAGIFEWVHDADAPHALLGANHAEILAAGRFSNSPRILREYALQDDRCDFLKTLVLRGDIHPDDLERFEAFRLCTDYSTYRDTLCRVHMGEGYLWHKFTLVTMLDGQYIERMVGTVLNVDLETRAARAQELSNMRYRTVLQQTDTIEFEYDMVNDQGYISPVLWERYDAKKAVPGDRRELIDYLHVYHGDAERVSRTLEQFRTERPRRCELRCRIRDKTGNYVWCRVIMDCIRDNAGRLTRVLGTLHNIDSETRAYEALKEKAEHDGLTGIWNQEKFFSAVDGLLSSWTPDRKMALIMMDIDKFKVINEIFGMDGGNRALALVGRVLRGIFGTDGYYARMYADVFCMLTPYKTDGDLSTLMARIIGGLSSREFDFMLVPRFGVCRVSNPSISSTELVERAGYAHKSVKAAAGKQWAFYDESMRNTVIEQKQIESEMEQALEKGQFQIYLQPKYCLPLRKVEGAEALVRWIHPQKGLIPPGKFIPLFEENGFITRLDTFVWEESCRLIRRWMDEGKPPLPISVNVSRLHIHNKDLLDTLIRLTEQYRIPRGMLELELTESMFPDNMQALFTMVRDLQDAGFVLAMDDFGSGYSSLNMLKDMPLNVLKIDCEFFGETDEETRGRTVVRHTVAMAHELDMRVVAEGVETESEADFLSETGCDTAQGFYFARPVPVPAFEALAFPE